MKPKRPSQGPPGKVPEGYITKFDVAQRLKKGLRTIDRWRVVGLIPYHKMGKFVYFKWDEVEKQLAEVTKVQMINSMLKKQSPF
ncbi:MAG TPA: hypothetical protein VK633_12845 [Verrucomicrobiae bacterium]|nr:hypothetical protein [Verrucomicrobiae bacterium]